MNTNTNTNIELGYNITNTLLSKAVKKSLLKVSNPNLATNCSNHFLKEESIDHIQKDKLNDENACSIN